MIHWHWVGYHRFYSTKSKLPYLLISCFSFRTLIAGNAGVLCPGLHFPWQRMELQGQMVGPRTRKLRERCLKCSEMYGSNVTLQAQEQIPLHQNPTLGIHIHTQLVYLAWSVHWLGMSGTSDHSSMIHHPTQTHGMPCNMIWYAGACSSKHQTWLPMLSWSSLELGYVDHWTQGCPQSKTLSQESAVHLFFQQFVPSLSTFCWIHCASFNHVFGKTLAFILRNEVEQTYSTGKYCVVLPHYPHSCQKSSWI